MDTPETDMTLNKEERNFKSILADEKMNNL